MSVHKRSDKRSGGSSKWLWLGGIAIAALIGYGVWTAVLAVSHPAAGEGAREVYLPAPQVAFTDIDNISYRLSDFYDRPTVITFIALWCSSCEYAVAEVEAFQRRHPGEVNYLMVDVDPVQDTRTQLRAFATAHPNDDFYFVFDDTGQLASAFDVDALQTTVVVSSGGNIVYRDRILSEVDDLERALNKANASDNKRQ